MKPQLDIYALMLNYIKMPASTPLFKSLINSKSALVQFTPRENFIETNFNLLIGPYGTLSEEYTEYLLKQSKDKLSGYIAFYDIFNNKLLNLFYSSWLSSQLIELNKSAEYTILDIFSKRKFFYYAKLYSFRWRSRQALKQLISSYYSISCEDIKLNDSKLILKQTQLSLLTSDHQQAYLGKNLRLGTVVTIPAKLSFCFTCISYHQYKLLILNPAFLSSLSHLIKHYLLHKFVFKLRFQVKFNQPYRSILHKSEPLLLAWNSWLGEVAPNTQTMIEISSL